MNWHWKFGEHSLLVIALLLCLVHQELSFCWSLNDEGLALLRFKERVESDPFGALSNWKDGDGVENPCTWFGVECFNGNVASLGDSSRCMIKRQINEKLLAPIYIDTSIF